MSEIMHSKKVMASYGVGSYINEFIQGVLIFMLFYFYEVEVGLASWMTGLALGIYAVWDAFNDPLIGYFTDRPFSFTKNWGRRFPWIVIGYIPMLISFILVFSPPNVNAQEEPWVIFGWLVFTLCLFDTCETIYSNNYSGLFPDKFRGQQERVQASGIIVYIGIIGVVFANILPPIIIVFGDVSTFALMAWICVSINFFVWFLMLPGVRDDKETIEKFITSYEEREKEPFLKTLKKALKQNSLVAYLLFYLTYQTLTTMVQGSFLYWIRFIILGDAGDILLVMVLLLVGVMVGTPLWYIFNRKTANNRKTMIYAAAVFILFTFLFTVITNLTGLLILAFFWGIGLGGFWVMISPTFGDVVDESISRTGIRREGFFAGLRTFMSNIAKIVTAFFFATVHELTGFVEQANIQTTEANFGILLLFGVIPAITMGFGLLVFWKFYDITPGKSRSIREALKELKI